MTRQNKRYAINNERGTINHEESKQHEHYQTTRDTTTGTQTARAPSNVKKSNNRDATK